MENITAGAIRAGWEIFKKRPWFIILAPIGAYLLVYILSLALDELSRIGQFMSLLTGVANIALNTLLSMGITAFFLKAYDDPAKLVFADLWHPQPFLSYFLAGILTFILTILGLVLLIVPGIIVSVMIAFSSYLIIDRNLGPIEALKESARLTKGRRWHLFLFFVLLALINIAGLFALVVGLFVTLPVSTLAFVHVFRKLEQQAGAIAPAQAA